MTNLSERSLEGMSIGISVSDSPDLGVLGLDALHVEDALVQLSEHLFSEGANLVYGGDLRSGGFTRVLFNAARTYNAQDDAIETKIKNLIAWPIHQTWSDEDKKQRRREFRGCGTLELLGPPSEFADSEWPSDETGQSVAWDTSLTDMRQKLVEICDAFIFLGGRVEDFKGSMPGIAQEAILALKNSKPMYLCGGFGGMTSDICQKLGGGIVDYKADRSSAMENPNTGERYRSALSSFNDLSLKSMSNGLSDAEKERLSQTSDGNELLILILKGLRKGRTAADF